MINIPTKRDNYNFEGPYDDSNSLQDRSGVYAILDKRQNSFQVVDIGESSQVKSRVENHDRKSCWAGKALGKLVCAVLYTPNLHQQGRVNIEQDIRSYYTNLCGER